MLDALLGLGDALGTRFRVLGILPSVVLVGFVLALLEGGAPGDAPDVNDIAAAVKGLQAWEGVLLLLGIVAVALLAEPLQLSLVRLLEGYWGGSVIASLAARPLLKRQHRGRDREQELERKPEGSISVSRRSLAAWRLRYLYPAARVELLPTRLGNVLRAAEVRAGDRYGLDAVVLWPRLYPLLPDGFTGIVDDQRGQLDVSARFCAVFLAAAVISAALLAQHGWWLMVPLGAVLLAVLSYRAAISAAIAYGLTLESAFDLHRFDLLAALHLPLPPDRTTERSANKKLSDFLRQGVPANFAYSHAGREKSEGETVAEEPMV
jgi:hypothetical protein